MIDGELVKKVRKIEIVTGRLVDETFAGQYVSVFKGRGMEFSEVREYIEGDDVRTIDWNVTARTGRPFVKRYVEERELTVMLLVDASASSRFGTATGLKRDIAAEICAILAFSAIQAHDKIGLLLFTDRIEKYIPPGQGRRHVLRVIRDLLYHEPTGSGTDIGAALDFLARVQKRRTVAFLVSDFIGEGFDKPLQIANKRHDVVAVSITDPREIEMPDVGLIELEDAETGEIRCVDTSDPAFREQFRALADAGRGRLARTFRSLGVDSIDIRTDQDAVGPLVRFFRERAHRFR
jgi:uncharacterized protein (DUF58 family)